MAKPTPKPDQVKPEAQAPVPAPAVKKTPTAKQRELLRKGGDYRFDPATGELVQTRKPTKGA